MISTIVASASQAMHFNAYFLAYILAGLSYTQITLTTDQIAYSSNVHIAHCTRKSWRNCSACMRFSLFLMCSKSLSESHLGVRINWMMFNGTFFIVFFCYCLCCDISKSFLREFMHCWNWNSSPISSTSIDIR